MNLLMLLLIVLAIWVGAMICYFAWRLMSQAEEDGVESGSDPDP